MWVRIETGPGSPGKLWTGSEVPTTGTFAKVELVEFRSPEGGSSTRRLFIDETREEAPEGIRIPTLHVSTGGVGSLVGGCVITGPYGDPTTLHEENRWLTPFLVWNWSGRMGGYLILDPVQVLSGHVRRDEVNSALPGYAWIHTYEGSTLSEYVLVRTHQADSDEGGERPIIDAVDERHVLPIHRIVHTLLSPPQREEKLLQRAEQFLDAEVGIEEIADAIGYPIASIGDVVGSEDLTTLGGVLQSSIRRYWKGLDQLVERKLGELEWAAIQAAPPEQPAIVYVDASGCVDVGVVSRRPRREPRPSPPERVPRFDSFTTEAKEEESEES